MRVLIAILISFVFNSIKLQAQLSVDKTVFDFGGIVNFKNDTAYFYITNNSIKTTYLLPTQPKEDYLILTNGKQILPNESLTLAVVYFTGKKGKFSLDVPIYFSSSSAPLILNIRGNIISIDRNALNTCPSIENSISLRSHVPLDIVVKDFVTEKIITEATVQVTRRNKVFACIAGLGNRSYQCNCDYGRVNVEAKKEGYLKGELEFEYSEKEHYCVVYLKKADTLEVVIPKITEISKKVNKDTIKPKLSVMPIDTSKLVSKTDIDKPDSVSKIMNYKPNHLVFVIDISGSMKDTNKLAYLKESMKALIGFLRPNDFVTLITYTARQNIVFENISGSNKLLLLQTIDSLTAGGGSYGADALDIAYTLARKHFIEGGNNQIFLATDGMFNGSKLSDEDLYKKVKKQFKKYDIKLSTIAFGKYSRALEFLANLALNGSGQSLKIQTLPNDNNVLIEEVKKQSLIN